MRFRSGWVKIYRSVNDHLAGEDGYILAIFTWLLTNANRETSKARVGKSHIELPPGDLMTSRPELVRVLGFGEQVIRTRLLRLAELGTIITKSNRRGMIITICNWDKYQTDQPAPNRHLTGNQPATNHIMEKREERREKDTKTVEESSSPPLVASRPPLSSPDPRDLLKLWNEGRRGGQPAVRESTFSSGTKRWTWSRSRLIEQPDLEYWRQVVAKIAASPFCCGENDRAWCADFDFLLRRDTHLKVMEGKYDDKQKQKVASAKERWDERMKRFLEKEDKFAKV